MPTRCLPQALPLSFALADKQLKLSLQEKWSKVSDYLTDNHFSTVVGKWTDVNLEVVGGNYIIFTVLYESLVDGIYLNVKLSNDFVNNILDGKYNYVVITNDEWNRYKDAFPYDYERNFIKRFRKRG